MKSKNRVNYIKIFPHFVVNLLLCIFIIIITSVICIILQQETTGILRIIFTVIVILCCLTWIIWSNIFGWNAIIVFEESKITQRRGLKKRTFYWDEIEAVTCRTHRPFFLKNELMYAPKFVFIFNDKKTKLSVVLHKFYIEKVIEICPSDRVKDQIQHLYNACDYNFE